ncbi:hypothetical protein KM043_001948 [Ampulex compressa]|nr:hypothetical protein KM043_001948 [Ampulex compressa]
MKKLAESARIKAKSHGSPFDLGLNNAVVAAAILDVFSNTISPGSMAASGEKLGSYVNYIDSLPLAFYKQSLECAALCFSARIAEEPSAAGERNVRRELSGKATAVRTIFSRRARGKCRSNNSLTNESVAV